MQGTRLDGLRVAILVFDTFEQVEMTSPRQALTQAGAQTTLISPNDGPLTGLHHVEKGDAFPVDLKLDQADAHQFDALVLPGGAVNADQLRTNQQALTFIKQFESAGKPLAVICHAPWALISAGLVRGRTLTSWPSIRDDIGNAGGTWVDQSVVQDRNWVTSRGPQDLPVFNSALMLLFAQRLARR